MKIAAFLFAIVWCQSVTAADWGVAGAKHWTTSETLKAATVLLRWTGDDEAPPSVCGISYRLNGSEASLEVWGQPTVNKAASLIAFLTCRDDGCDRRLRVAD